MFGGFTNGEWWLVAEVRDASSHLISGKDLVFMKPLQSSSRPGVLRYGSSVLGRLLAVSVIGLRRMGVRLEDYHEKIDEDTETVRDQASIRPPVADGKELSPSLPGSPPSAYDIASLIVRSCDFLC